MREACVGPYERRAVSTKVNSVGNDDPDILIPCRRNGCFDLKGEVVLTLSSASTVRA